MQRKLHHIARPVLATFFTVVFLMIAAGEVFADKSRKAPSKTSSVPATLTSPALTAAEVVVNAMGQRAATKSAKVNVANDTSKTESRIISVRATPDVLQAKVDLATDQQQVDLAIFNMLGKRMTDVYRGPASKGEHEYTTSISDLPEGVYICILQGSNFRRAEKFYLSR